MLSRKCNSNFARYSIFRLFTSSENTFFLILHSIHYAASYNYALNLRPQTTPLEMHKSSLTSHSLLFNQPSSHADNLQLFVLHSPRQCLLKQTRYSLFSVKSSVWKLFSIRVPLTEQHCFKGYNLTENTVKTYTYRSTF